MDPNERNEARRSAMHAAVEREKETKRRLIAAATSWSRLDSLESSGEIEQIIEEASSIEWEFDEAELPGALSSALSLVLDAVRLWAEDVGRSPDECLQMLGLALEAPDETY